MPSGFQTLKQPVVAPLPTRSHRLIYLAEDDERVGRVVQAILRSNYQVRFFQDPLEAYHEFCAASPKPRLLLTDYMMSPINGLELIQRCKAVDPSLRTILYSGNAGAEVLLFSAVPPDRFLSKPFLPTSLTSLIAELLRSSASDDESEPAG